MFKNLFKKNVKSIPDTQKKIVTPCACEGNNEHCDLVLQLRKLQDRRKEIKNEIEALNKNDHELIINFINFLCKLEDRCLFIDYVGRHITSERNVNIIKETIGECSSADIFRIAEELKTFKNKDDIICEKRRALKAVENNIKDIKIKLGIE